MHHSLAAAEKLKC